MSSDIKGVFVRLPLSEEQRDLMVYAAALGQPDDSHDKAILAIGTPVNGNELACAGSVKWYANDPDPIVETYVPSAFEKGASVSIVDLSDALALLAARDAEIVRKYTRIAELEEELSGFRAGLSELIAKEIVVLKGSAA